MRALWLVPLGLLAAWLLVVALVWIFQRRLQYFPDPADPPAPPGVEPVTLTTADGVRLRAWYRPGPRDAVLLLLHGNAGHRGDRFAWMDGFHERGWGLFLLDYRGYGGSGGSPTEEGLIEDGAAAVAFLEARGVKKTVYVGESLGVGVAVGLAVWEPPAALVLQSGADSLVNVGRKSFPFLPVSWLMKDRFDSAARIGKVSCPVLCIHGDEDELIPFALGRALFEAANEPKEFLAVEGAGHNDVWMVGGQRYYERVHAFLLSSVS